VSTQAWLFKRLLRHHAVIKRQRDGEGTFKKALVETDGIAMSDLFTEGGAYHLFKLLRGFFPDVFAERRSYGSKMWNPAGQDSETDCRDRRELCRADCVGAENCWKR
jgi:hypothetical protein